MRLDVQPSAHTGKWSPYKALAEDVRVTSTADVEGLMSVIHDVKTHGSGMPGLADRWAAIVEGVDADVILLACTELPLLPRIDTAKKLMDVTDLLAAELARQGCGWK